MSTIKGSSIQSYIRARVRKNINVCVKNNTMQISLRGKLLGYTWISKLWYCISENDIIELNRGIKELTK